jgi:AraC-like DNA-binding protein
VDPLCASQGTGSAARDRAHTGAAAVRFGFAAQPASSSRNYLWTTAPKPNGGACGGLFDRGGSVTEIGGAALLRDRADLLYNRTLPLEAVLPRQAIEEVQNTLAVAREIRKQASALEQFLQRQIYSRNRASQLDVSPQIKAAARMIRVAHGRYSIATIAHRTAMSLSALERQFRATVGASPKHLSRLARLHYVCALWDSGRTLTEIAAEAGYSDQSHLVRDFQLFTGTSPTQFFLSASPRNLPTFYK